MGLKSFVQKYTLHSPADTNSNQQASLRIAVQQGALGELHNVLGDIEDRAISVDQLKSIGDSITYIEDMIRQTQEKTEESAVLVANGKSKNETCVRVGKECKNRLTALNDHFKSIEQLLKTIDQISVKTTLLALNAKTEAARAGEHGRGFSVVANEIGMLAASSMKAKNQIQEILESIQEASESVTESFTRSGNSLQELLDYNDQIASNIENIREDAWRLKERMEESSAGLNALTGSVEGVNCKLGDFTVIGRALSHLISLRAHGLHIEGDHDCLKQFEKMAQSAQTKSPLRLPPSPSGNVDYPANAVLISQTDTRGVITFANNTFCEIAGYTSAELTGKPHNLVRHAFMPRGAFANLWETLQAGLVWQGLVVNRCKNDQHYWVKAVVYPSFENGVLIGYTSIRTKPTADQIRRAEAAYQWIP